MTLTLLKKPFSRISIVLLLFAIGISSHAQNVNLTMDINAKNSSLDIYLTAVGSSYTTQRFDNLTFTIRWPNSASFNLGGISQPTAIASSFPLAKFGAETTSGGFEYQVFTYNTGSSFSGSSLVLNDGVKTLFAQIDVTGYSPNLDLCTILALNDGWTSTNNGDYSISIASTNRTGGFSLREAISTTYSSGIWNPCDITNIRRQNSGGDTVNIADGIYQYNDGFTYKQYTQFNVMPGAALQLIAGAPTTPINFKADANGYAQFLDPSGQMFNDESTEGFIFEQYVGTNPGWRHIGGMNNIISSKRFTFNTGGAPLNYGASGNLFYFDPSTFDWAAVPSAAYVPSAPANNGRGLAIFLGGTHFPVTDGIIKWNSPSDPGFRSLNCTYHYTADHNLSQGASYNGWNLIGNWWTADIDYHVYNDGLPFDGYSVWTPTGAQTGSYSSYSEAGGGTGAAGRYIAPGQAFWVKGTTANDGADFTINAGDFTLNGSGTRWHNRNKTNPNPTNKGTFSRIRLNVESLSGTERDAAIIIFPGLDATASYEGKYDVFKQQNPSPFPNIYTRTTNQEDLAINGIGGFSKDRIIPVFFNCAQKDGSYRINYEKTDADPNWGDLYLVDHFTGITHNLSQNGDYVFSNSLLAPEERFQLQFSANISLNEYENDRIKIFSYESTIAISRAKAIGNLKVSVYNIAGQKVYDQTFGEEKLIEFNTGLPSAYYIVKAQDAQGIIQSEKIVLK